MNRRLLVLGILLVCSGLLFGAVQSGAFDQVSADRGVSVAVAGDSEAYLASTGVYDGQEVSNYECIFWIFCDPVDDSRTAIELENRYVEPLNDLEVEAVNISGTADDTLQVSAAPVQLERGEIGEVDLACGESVVEDGTADVTVKFSASGPIEIHGAPRLIEDVTYDCDSDP